MAKYLRTLTPLLFIFLLFIAATPFSVSAYGYNTDPGIVLNGKLVATFDKSASGTGWSYDAKTTTLTLNNFQEAYTDGLFTTGESELEINDTPEGFTLHLTDNTTNIFGYIRCSSIAEKTCHITGSGTLKCVGQVDGSFILDSGTLDFDYLFGNYITINGGNFNLRDMEYINHFTMNSGIFECARELSFADMRITGGVVKGAALSNLYGCALNDFSFSLTGGSLLLEGGTVSGVLNKQGVLGFYIEDTDDSAAIEKKLKTLGTVTDKNGEPLSYKFISGGDESNPWCGVTLMDKAGHPATYAKFEPPHTCKFNQKNTIEDHQKSAASCKEKAVYYYSCTCGKNGSDTFESGSLLAHKYDSKGICSVCNDKKDSATTPSNTNNTTTSTNDDTSDNTATTSENTTSQITNISTSVLDTESVADAESLPESESTSCEQSQFDSNPVSDITTDTDGTFENNGLHPLAIAAIMAVPLISASVVCMILIKKKHRA